MSNPDLVLGLDFSTDSVCTPLIDADGGGNGMGKGVSSYSRWLEGKYCRPAESQFRQHPRDYLESMDQAVRQALTDAGTKGWRIPERRLR